MPTTTSPDDTFTYHNRFENSLFVSASTTTEMSTSKPPYNDPTLQSFTATGRPLSHYSASRKGTGLDGLSSFDSLGAGAPNLLPVRFTDQSIISVAVLPPPDLPEGKLEASNSDEDDNPVKGLKPKSRFSFSSFRRKSSSKKEKRPDFVMKDMTRAEYLKHYAKDDNGKYIGTDEPASDCILNGEDITKRRKQFAFREAMSAGPTMFI